MTHAYSESYLADAKNCLASMLDYAVHDCKLEADWFGTLFIQSGIADRFERGDPWCIAGKSGIELANEVLHRAGIAPVSATFSQERSPEYWAGWALAEYQWFTGRSFRDILRILPISHIIGMYPLFHEMDISQFIDAMEKAYQQIPSETHLKRIRENRGLSQTELAKLSGVRLRSIQMYEQRGNDIDKAQSQTLFKLSRVLGCSIEDLLEHPSGCE